MHDSARTQALARAMGEGRQWAEGLKIGDTFRGSKNEGKYRYPKDLERAEFFHQRALELLNILYIRIKVCKAHKITELVRK
jgi:hypothetical protein